MADAAYIADLKDAADKAEAKAFELQAKRDDALADLRGKHDQKVKDAVNDAAEKQKAWMDAEAAAALVGRDDAGTVADNLGLTEAYQKAVSE